ncbi:MAG: TonB-dependent receptor [Sphingomonas sp.]
MLKGLLVSSIALAAGIAAPAWAQDTVDAAASAQANAGASPKSGDIVVTGIRRSLSSAQAIKRDSDSIVDSIVAEDIGKLSDVTVAESVARITGVQVHSAQGEASGVLIRGLADVATTYDGREIFTGNGRYVALQDFPAGSIGRIDVYKSATAQLVEPGIAGLVDVHSQRPFDFRKDQFFGSLSGLHWYQSQALGYDANLLISKRWNTSIGEIGVLASGSYTQIKYIDATRINNLTISNRTNLPAYPGGIFYPSTVNTDYDAADRWRPSATFSVQWRPSSALEFHIDGLFQGYRSNGENRNLQSTVGPAAALSNIEFFPGTNMVKSMDATGGAFPTGTQHVINGNTDTYLIGGGFTWRNGRLKLSGDLAYDDSKFESTDFQFNFSLLGAPKKHYDFDADAGAGGGTVILSGYDLTDPSHYRLVGIAESGSISAGQETQARLDAEYDLGGAFLDKLQLGVRYSDRRAQAYNFTQNHVVPAGTLYTTLPLQYRNLTPGFRNDEAVSQRLFLVPTRASLSDNMDYLRDLATLSTPSYGDPVYDSDEKSYSAYAQLRYKFDIGVPIDGMIGVRAVHTDDVITGTNRDTQPDPDNPGSQVVVVTPVTKRNNYTDFLPNISSRIHLADRLQARLAFTMTRTRPNFGNLNPTLTIALPPTVCIPDPGNPDNGPDSPSCVRTASGGNGDLEPTRSKNYDFSLEYYPTRSSSATIGLFRRDVKGFISNFTVETDDPEYGRLRITRPDNGGDGHIQGVEAAASTFLSAPWLPDWLHKFGIQGNVTYLDHSSELPEALSTTLPGQQPIANVSKWLYNLIGFYETKGFSVRLAYNHRSKFVVEYDRLSDDLVVPMMRNGFGQLSLSATATPTENVSFTFSATNLLGAFQQNWRAFDAQGDKYIFQTRFLESVYRVGVRFRF